MPVRQHDPFEGALKQRQLEEKQQQQELEAARHASAQASALAERERVAAEEAARPRPTGPSASDFLALVAQAADTDAKLSLLKARAADVFGQGFPRQAAELYSVAIQLQASHALHGNRSACRCAHADYDAALDDALACLRLHRGWAKGYARQGAALHGLGRFDEAVRAYEEGLRVEPGNAALEQGLADALRRRAAAGGSWEVAVDGGRQALVSTRAGDVRMSQLGGVAREGEERMRPLGVLCAAPNGQVLAADGFRPKIFSLRTGLVAREFNTAHEDSGAKTFSEAVSGLALDPTGVDPALYAVEPRSGTLFRLLIRDTRSLGCKKEAPDKVMVQVDGARDLGLDEPSGLALVDTRRMGGGGSDSTLYVCDSGNGRVLALDPKELTLRFAVGRPGSADDELGRPVGVCACEDLMAIADASHHRVSVFTLRGTFVRIIGGRPSKFSAGARAGQFVRPPAHVAMAPGHLFVLEAGGSRVHVLSPETGEPLGLILPPFNAHVSLDAKGAVEREAAAPEGCLTGLCVDDDALYVGSNLGPPRILRLPRTAQPQRQQPSLSNKQERTTGHEAPPQTPPSGREAESVL